KNDVRNQNWNTFCNQNPAECVGKGYKDQNGSGSSQSIHHDARYFFQIQFFINKFPYDKCIEDNYDCRFSRREVSSQNSPKDNDNHKQCPERTEKAFSYL